MTTAAANASTSALPGVPEAAPAACGGASLLPSFVGPAGAGGVPSGATTKENAVANYPGPAGAEEWVPKDTNRSFLKRHENIFLIYLGFISVTLLLWQTYEDAGLSTFLTLSVAVQLFALTCLWYQVKQQRGVQGVSMRSLVMQCFVYGLRLSSSSWLKGYIPTDSTGDGLYQVLDLCTMMVAMYLIHSCAVTHRSSYQEKYDGVEIKPLIMLCALLAVLVHPDLNDRPLFDVAWTTSLYIDSVAMLPQLWMMTSAGGARVLTGHYVAAMAVSRSLNFVFWYHGYGELATLAEDGETAQSNLPGYGVLTAHVVQLLLMADFLFYYIKAFAGRSGCGPRPAQGQVIQL